MDADLNSFPWFVNKGYKIEIPEGLGGSEIVG